MSILFDNVTARYPNAPQDALRNVSFALPSSSFALLVGHNGAGKSTLVRLMNGMIRPKAGVIAVNGLSTDGIPTSRLAAEVAVTFQNPADQLFAPTVRDEVAFGPRNLRLPGIDDHVSDALALCGLTSVADRHPYDLSLAERKLLTIASAVAMQTPVLAFDEPNAGLSQPERRRLHTIFSTLKARGRMLLVISHDLGQFLSLTDLIIALDGGSLVYDGTPSGVSDAEKILRRTGVRFPFSERVVQLLEK